MQMHYVLIMAHVEWINRKQSAETKSVCRPECRVLSGPGAGVTGKNKLMVFSITLWWFEPGTKQQLLSNVACAYS